MNRSLTYFIGPEIVLTALSLAVFWYCGRHNSGQGDDIRLMEKLVMLMPFVVVPLVFATIFVPGAKNWWWLGRAIGFTFVMLLICGGRVISGFGSGAKGQDAAFLILIMFGTLAVSVATAVTGAMILGETRPAFAEWFSGRRFLGTLLTLIASIPIGFVLGVSVTLISSCLAMAYSVIKR